MATINPFNHVILNQQTNEMAFQIFTFEHLNRFSHLQRKNYYSLILLMDGHPTINIDLRDYTIIQDQKIMIGLSPYQPYQLTADEPCWGYALNFHPDFFCTYRHQNEVQTEGVLFHSFLTPPLFYIEEEHVFVQLLKQMEREMSQKRLAQHELLVAYLKIFLIEAVRCKSLMYNITHLAKVSERPQIIQDLIDAIELNFKSLHTPKDYATLLHTSAKTLGRLVKNHFDLTFSDMIANKIITEAKRELYLTSKSIKEIAAALGYKDEFYFSRFFKKKVGVSPNVYRKTVGFAKMEQI